MTEKMYRVTILGKTMEYPAGTSLKKIADEVKDLYKDDIVLAVLDNTIRELTRTLEKPGRLDFLTTADKAGRKAYRRSMTFLMEAALEELEPELSVSVQHSIGQGYYCELRAKDGSLYIPDGLFTKRLSDKMREMQEEDCPIYKKIIHTRDAVRMFGEAGMHDKEKLLRYRRSSWTNIYELKGHCNYFYGSMVPSAGYLKYFSLECYQDGFMLMFPDGNTREVAKFSPSDKLFHILIESADWGSTLGVDTVGGLNEAIADGRIQDLILIQEAAMEQNIGEIAKRIASDPERKFVMIAGPSSSGKTTFSHRLAIQLRAQGLKPHPISLDDFYVNREETPKDADGEYDFECLEAIDIQLFNDIMNGLLKGEKRHMPVFNFKTGRREYRGTQLQMGRDDILVIEGIHGLNDRLSYQMPGKSKFKIYISALTQLNIDEHNNLSTRDGRLLRRIVRDARTRNTSARDTLARWESVRRGEEKNIFPFQEDADVMFNSALIYELAVLKLYAEPLLFHISRDCPEYLEAKRLLKLLDYCLPVPGDTINHNSIIREFIGGSCFHV